MRTDPRRLTCEGPTVVGLMTSVMESGGSIDGAIRAVAEDGPPLSAGIFTRAVRLSDTKGSPGLCDSLSSGLAELPESASGYRQAILLCVSASDASDPQERLRILREASDVSLDAVRIMGERYAAGLSTPCMAVFGLGIMAPMILMSILPIMGIGGMFGSMPIDSGTLLMATLVLIPAAIFGLSYWLRRSNPFLDETLSPKDAASALPLLIALPLYLVIGSLGTGAVECLTLSVAPAALACLILMYEGHRADVARVRAENGLKDCVFELGNSLLGGENFERVAVEAISSRVECRPVGLALSRELDLCRGDVCRAVESAVSPVSREVSRTLCDIQRCSEKDTEDAGRLAIAVGRQFQNQSNIMSELELKLKGMTDMMVGTAMLFAPLVLGMSASMLGPLSEISGYTGLEGTEAVLAAYLVELCAIIAVLTSSLGRGDGVRGMVWRFCISCPVALVVFWVCTGIQLRRRYPWRGDGVSWNSGGGWCSPVSRHRVHSSH